MTEKKQSILIIDDDPNILKLVKFYLERDKYTIEGAHNGKEAISIVTKRKFDLILVDMLMPQMDGLTFIKELKEELHLECPVILVTAQEPTERMMNIIYDYGYDFIQKPFTSIRLSLTVHNALKYKDLQDTNKRLLKKQ
jgi:DNA-binding NtrC family response regulator